MAGSRRRRRLLRRGAWVLGGLFLLAGVFFTQTPWGREMVLREILRRVEGTFQGTLSVQGLSSPGLLRGFTLKGVVLAGEDGRPFLVADSLMAGVSPRALLAGDLVFTRVRIWSPDVVLERLPGRERMNVQEIFAPGRGEGPDTVAVAQAEEGEASGPELPPALPAVDSVGGEGGGPPPEGRTVAFRGLTIEGGTLEIRLPLSRPRAPGDRALTALDGEGRPSLRRYTFRDLNLRLREATVLTPLEEGETFDITELTFRGEVWENPFRLSDLQGTVRRMPGRLTAELERVDLPASEAAGELEVEWGRPQGVQVTFRGDTPGMALADLHWIDPRLPQGIARGSFGLVLDRDGVQLDFRDTRLALPQGSLRATGGVSLGSRIRLNGLDLRLDGVGLDILDPWFPEPLPLDGLTTGDLQLSGTPSALGASGELTLVSPDSIGLTEALFSGTFHLGDSLALSGFQATLAPLEWSTFASLSPRMTLGGPGALRVEADGPLREGLFLNVEATHVPGEASPSRVTAAGTVGFSETGLYMDLAGELSPLSFTTLRRDFPDLPLTGEVAGSVSVRGPLSALRVESELSTSAGPLTFTAEFDARDPLAEYSVDADVQEFLLSGLVLGLPEPTRLTGRLLASGRGAELETLQGEAEVFLRRGEVGALRVDTAALVARVEGGLLMVDALTAETGVGQIEGGGAFGLSPTSPPGELNVRVRSESLAGLRPFIMGETPVILDDLTPMERNWLIMGGADLDTIPSAEEVALDGSLQGQATFRGGWEAFSGEGSLSFQGLRYRREYLEAGTVTFSAQELPGPDRRLQALLRTDSLFLYGQGFQAGEGEVDIGDAGGRVRVALSREGNEEYRGRGTYALDGNGAGQVNLDEVLLRFDTIRWNLGGPSSLTWSPEGVDVRDFRLIRPGVGRMRVEAHGFLPFQGEGDFQVDVEEFHLERLARIAQMDTPMEGSFDLHLRRTGTAASPRMEGFLRGVGFQYGDLTIGGVDADFRYEALSLSGEIRATEDGREVMVAAGSFPMDLRFQGEDPLIPEAPVELGITVDSFPARLALAVLESVEEVEGTLSGTVELGGTPRHLEPDGEILLSGGSMSLPALGVRYREANATFRLNPDARVEVTGTFRSQGQARVAGAVTLSPFTNPSLDLTLEAEGFQAARRRDVEGRVTGALRVLSSYRRPRVQGRVRVDQGVLRVEELARATEVVNLADPAFFRVVQGDAPLRRAVEASQNPFLQNLMLDVEMELGRGSWLRGQDLDVEMGGSLQVFWDRTERDLALVGELQAVRGAYTFWNRQFQVQEGTVSFLGTPGVNPNLNITAQHRMRRAQENDLTILATLTGTLLAPRVALTSDSDVAIAESDLVSYLIFGAPSYALASGQSDFAKGVAGSLLGAASGAGANFLVGAFSSQLGSVVARDVGLDFLAITQGEYIDPWSAGRAGTLSTTQVEIGQYLTQDVYAALLWRPLTNLSSETNDQFAGLRVEWRLADFWTVEGFYEDPWSRTQLFRPGSLGYQRNKLLGFFFWREWGY